MRKAPGVVLSEAVHGDPATMISTPGGFGKWIGIREPWDLLISTRFLRLGT